MITVRLSLTIKCDCQLETIFSCHFLPEHRNNMILRIMNNTIVVLLNTGTADLFTTDFSSMHENKFAQDW